MNQRLCIVGWLSAALSSRPTIPYPKLVLNCSTVGFDVFSQGPLETNLPGIRFHTLHQFVTAPQASMSLGSSERFARSYP